MRAFLPARFGSAQSALVAWPNLHKHSASLAVLRST
jgi:hypothetical protein